MYIPFRRELNDVFQSDRTIWLKMGGSAIAADFVVLRLTVRGVVEGELDVTLTAGLVAVLAGISAVVGALLALALSLKDVVQRRVELDEPVNPLLKLYFGMGIVSLVVWFPTVLIAALAITVLVVTR